MLPHHRVTETFFLFSFFVIAAASRSFVPPSSRRHCVTFPLFNSLPLTHRIADFICCTALPSPANTTSSTRAPACRSHLPTTTTRSPHRNHPHPHHSRSFFPDSGRHWRWWWRRRRGGLWAVSLSCAAAAREGEIGCDFGSPDVARARVWSGGRRDRVSSPEDFSGYFYLLVSIYKDAAAARARSPIQFGFSSRRRADRSRRGLGILPPALLFEVRWWWW